jgi:rod shape-determining protein MreB and related proteins
MTFLNVLFRKLTHDVAIDLGTCNTLVYLKGKGIILDEPSVVALTKDERGGQKVLAIGKEAKLMLGRAPEKIEVIRPLKDGVIANFGATHEMLRHFIKKVYRRRMLVRPRIVVSIPVGITPVEKKAILECAKSAGAGEVFLIEEPMAAAIGAGLPITEPTGSMVVDIGGGTTEVAVISLGGIVYSKSVKVAGDKMDEAIVQHINRKYNFLIGLGTAEMIKISIGNAASGGEGLEVFEVKGRDLVSGVPKILKIRAQEVREMISEEVNAIMQAVRSGLEQMPPELSADILDRGIMLSGGGALLKNLDALLQEEMKVPITVAENPLLTVALGAGKALDNMSTFRDVLVD